ncbi:DNA replication and repair protein RadC [Lampropedia hyalina DSM 16112]|jgi:DNA repair protein RadC|uniref:DNA replication and repair protein RadC n=1 Tax=Lampropedia hyalina DSM 16112 TaxID=1122156 RepID=A0A1M5DKF2_9BURK|nr:DNA repair protein RadC [Lampropedia hyalina]SHF67430.1 DNA replication and repair protein RadC [Lampropedia hyalina DSM 16112]
MKDLPADSRPREKLLTRGASALSNAELLAILLRTGLPGQGVLALAQSLLQAQQVQGTGGFGGLTALLHASPADLARIKGLGPAKRAEILAVMELARRALAEQLQQGSTLNSPQAMRQYLQAHLAHKPHEIFAVLFLDSQLRLIALEELFRGTLTQTSVYPREIALRALHHHAHAIVLAHNHPSGQVQPSQADLQITRRIQDAMNLLDIQVIDHLIVARGQSLSMAERGMM